MPSTVDVYYFGDQTYDVTQGLQSLLAPGQSPVVESFLAECQYTVRREVWKLPQNERVLIPRFTNFHDLLRMRKERSLHPAFDQTLACAYQIGSFLRTLEQHGGSYPSSDSSLVLGLCTGTLAAAAVSSSKSLLELASIGPHTVMVAFLAGMRSFEAGRSLQGLDASSPKAWSTVVAGMNTQATAEAVEEFAKTEGIPSSSAPWISATSDKAVTVSGPPSVLARFRSSRGIAGLRSREIPIFSPYHAPHLFSALDVTEIINAASITKDTGQPAHLKVMFGASSSMSWAGNYSSMLQEALTVTLRQPLRWDSILEGVSKALEADRPSKVTFHPFGTHSKQGIFAELSQRSFPIAGKEPTVITDDGANDTQSKWTHGKSKIAIVGMSGRFPDSQNPDAFWNVLSSGLDVHKTVPKSHWDVETHTDKTGKTKNTSQVPNGCWLEDPGLFDAKFFNMSPREAPQVDPAQRLALLTAYEAIEEAGIVPDATPSTQKDRVGVFYGSTANDWMETNSAQNIDTYFIPGGNRAFIPGRINYYFKFSGPSYCIDTACSSSLASIHLACNSLWESDVDTAIAGGSNVLTNPDFTTGLDRGHFLSRTGNCKTFDQNADGYCRGEGVGTVVLKRLEDAIADNDPISGVICSTNTNHSAEAESITRPHVGAQKALFQRVLDSAGMNPYDISYVEMHGTGTQVGDAGEMKSVMELFAPPGSQIRKNQDKPLHIGAAKANVGHGEAAAGITSLAKVLLMMRNNAIPPHCGIKSEINRGFPTDLSERGVTIPDNIVPWPRKANGKRRVFLNNFSAAGGNTAALVEDGPMRTCSGLTDPRSEFPVAVSAKSATSLRGNLKSIQSYVAHSGAGLNLPSLSYTTMARRSHHPHRAVFTASTAQALEARVQEAIAADEGSKRPLSVPVVVFAFTGQGAQYAGMGKDLIQWFSTVRSGVQRFDHLAQSQGFPSFWPVFTEEANLEDYSPTQVQLATVCLEMAIFRFWMSLGVKPVAVVGHSLGEYAALNAAGILQDADTIYLVGTRAKLLEEKCTRGTHSMLAVKTSKEQLQKVLVDSGCELACINGPEDTVASGRNEDVAKVQKSLTQINIKCTLLKVPYAFHSSQVDPILKDFETKTTGVTMHNAQVPVLCPLHGSVIDSTSRLEPRYLVEHCRQPVNLVGAVASAKESKLLPDVACALEIGPHPVVTGMLKASLGSRMTAIATLQRGKDSSGPIANVMATLFRAGLNLNFREYYRDFAGSYTVLPLPAYSWDLKDYWIQYVNDWTLHKGEKQVVKMHESEGKPSQPKHDHKQISQTSTEVRAKSVSIESTTIHRIVEQTQQGATGSIVLESDISRADMSPLVQGHLVDGIPLCTPSVYADVALSIGDYLLKRRQSNAGQCNIDVDDMEITKALVAKPKGPQILRIVVRYNWDASEADCRFLSINDNGKVNGDHAHCTLRFPTSTKQSALQAQAPALKNRINALHQGLSSGQTFRFNKKMVYNMVQQLADFDPKYRAISEIVLDSDKLEAVGRVEFGNMQTEGRFHTHPGLLDALSQVGGFVLNANDKADLNKQVFINHGWKSFQIFEKLEPTATYTTHIMMKPGANEMYNGDIIIFDGERVVATFGGIALQGVSRRLLGIILSQESGSKAARKAAPKPPSAPKEEAKAPKAPEASVSRPANTTPAPPKQSAPTPPAPSLAQAPVPVKADNETLTKAMAIVAEESGLGQEQLTDDSEFAEIGVDSLLSLIIGSRFKDELGIGDGGSDLFSEMPTVGALKRSLGGSGDSSGTAPGTQENDQVSQAESQQPEATAASVPSTSASVEAAQSPPPNTAAAKAPNQPANETSEAFETALRIILEESGIASEDVTNETVFVDAGVDSLLSLIISSRFTEEVDAELGDASQLFADCPTVGDLKARFGVAGNGSYDASAPATHRDDFSDADSALGRATPSTSPTTASVATNDNRDEVPTKFVSFEEPPAPARPASSLVLQGRPRNAKHTFFLFPDGSGSASSYSKISSVTPTLALVGLNCPYRLHPTEMSRVKLDTLIDAYITEIRRRKPTGPYSFGGWSAGGILAYAAAQRLVREGEEVAHLVLIDSPAPKGLDRLPQRFFEHLRRVGVLGDEEEAPEWLVPHFNGTIDVLNPFWADPLPEGLTPRTSLVWAAKSVLDGVQHAKMPPGPDDTEGMKFLTEDRTDLSAGGWGDLFPGDEVVVEKAEDANHFSLVHERGDWLAGFLLRAVS